MRGFYLFIIWVMALAVTIAYASPPDKPGGSISLPAPVANIDLPDDDDSDSDDEEEIEEIEESDSDDEDEVVVEEHDDDDSDSDVPKRRKKRRFHSNFSLDFGMSFGRPLGCMVTNCQAFVPMQQMCGGYHVQGYANECVPPHFRGPAAYDPYFAEYPSRFMVQGGGCFCQGAVGCPCNQASSPVVFVNNVPPMPNIMPQWQGLQTRVAPVWNQQPNLFVLPRQQQPHLLPAAERGYIPREGFMPNAGMM